MVTQPEPDILECEVKWALESPAVNKASGGDGIPVELFKILKDDAIEVLLRGLQKRLGLSGSPGREGMTFLWR